MRKTSLILLLCALIGLSFAEPTILYQGTIEIKVPQEFNCLVLTPEIYHLSKNQMGDLRILTANNEQVPYFIQKLQPSKQTIVSESELTLVGSRREKERDVYDFKTSASENKDVLLNALEIQVRTGSEYLFEAQVWGSYNQEDYEWITTEPIYKVADGKQTVIDLGTEVDYLYYRIITDQAKSELVDMTVQGIRFAHKTLTPTVWVIENANFKITELDNRTQITIEDYANLPLSKLLFDIEGRFHRELIVEYFSGDTKVKTYRATLSQTQEMGTGSIKLPDTFTDYHKTVLTIINNDDLPLDIKGIDLEYTPDHLYFEHSDDGPFHLEVGDESLKRPSYDIIHFKEEISAKSFVNSEVSELKKSTNNDAVNHDSQKSATYYKFLLNGLILLAGALLIILSLNAIKKR